jgi:hypothetical protein
MVELVQSWEPWTRGDVVRAEGIGRFDGLDEVEDCKGAQGGATLSLVSKQESWDDTVLAMRASGGEFV